MTKDTIYLDNGKDGRHYCSICKQLIPKGIPRLRIFARINEYWSRPTYKKYRSVCGLCIKNISKNLNKKKMEKIKEEWTMNRVVKKL